MQPCKVWRKRENKMNGYDKEVFRGSSGPVAAYVVLAAQPSPGRAVVGERETEPAPIITVFQDKQYNVHLE